MKKVFLFVCFVVVITFLPFCFAESDTQAAIHEFFSESSTEDLIALKELIEFELDYRNYNSTEETTESETLFLDETLTRDLICKYFESNGIKIKRVMFQPLVEKDKGGLYGGKERWWVTPESGEMFAVWTANGKIEFCYNGEWYYDVDIYH